MRVSRSLALSIVLAVIAWTYTGVYVLGAKSSFLDDAFVYLHIARNIVETGSAQYFPITDNSGLLASSPLRLLLYLPGEAIAHAVYDGERNLAAARLSFLLSGLFTSLVFLPFYRKRWMQWGFGLAFSGFLARTAGTALQMEGLLIAWSFLTLTLLLMEDDADRSYFLKMGGLLAILTCSRLEFGIPAILVAVLDALLRRKVRLSPWLVVAPAAAASVWLLLSMAWNVYPIPTTYISKIMTGEAGWTVSFGERLLRMINEKFVPADLPIAILLAMALAMAFLARSFRLAWLIPIFAGAIWLLWGSSGYFTWYQENLFSGIMAVGLGALISLTRQSSRQSWLAAAILMIPAILFTQHINKDVYMPWNFKQPLTRATAYRAVGRLASGNGLYELPQVGSAYLMSIEIGIPAYFGGPDCWLVDMANLVTPGGFRGVQQHWLQKVYPRDLLRTPGEDYERVQQLIPEGSRSAHSIYQLQGTENATWARRNCQVYYADVGACLQKRAVGDQIMSLLSKPLR